jgi:hypothetical protein
VILIGVWFGEDERTNTLKTHVRMRLHCIFKFHHLVHTHYFVNTINMTYVCNSRVENYALPKTVTKSNDVQFQSGFLLTLHRTFANATHISSCNSDKDVLMPYKVTLSSLHLTIRFHIETTIDEDLSI